METSHRERRNFLKCFGLVALWSAFFPRKTVAAVAENPLKKDMPKAVKPQGLVAYNPKISR